MKRIWIAGLIIALLVGSASADPFIGNTLRYSIDVADGVDVTALGDTDVDFGTGDITTTGALSSGAATVTSLTNSGAAAMTNLDSSGTVVLSGIALESAPASYITATYTTSLAGDNNDIIWTAVAGSSWGGTLGNSIDIIYTDPGEDTTTCSVSANTSTGDVDITLSYGTGAINATAQDVIDAVAADATAALMVVGTNATDNDGSGTVTALATQDLSGGVNGTAGTTGTLGYYSGDIFYLVSGSYFYDATWAQWDGADTDGTIATTRAISSTAAITTTNTATAEHFASTDDIAVADDGTFGGLITVTESVTCNDGVVEDDLSVGGEVDLAYVASSISGTNNSAYVVAVQTIVTPDASTADLCLNDVDLNTSETNYSTIAAQPDVARCLAIDVSGTCTGTVKIHGTDIAGSAIWANHTFSASDVTQTTAKAFLTVDYVLAEKTAGDDVTFDLGTTDALGLNTLLSSTANVLWMSYGAVRESTFPAVTVSSTVLSQNTADPQTACDGTDFSVAFIA